MTVVRVLAVEPTESASAATLPQASASDAPRRLAHFTAVALLVGTQRPQSQALTWGIDERSAGRQFRQPDIEEAR